MQLANFTRIHSKCTVTKVITVAIIFQHLIMFSNFLYDHSSIRLFQCYWNPKVALPCENRPKFVNYYYLYFFFLHNKLQQMWFLLMSEKWSSRNDLRFPLRNYFSQQLLTCLVSFPLECCLYVNVALVILSETALSNAVCASFDPMYSAYFCSRVFFGSDWLRQFYLIRCHPDLTS